MYTIKLNKMPFFSGVRYGLTFIKGETKTDDKYIADRLKAKGFEVTEKKSKPEGK